MTGEVNSLASKEGAPGQDADELSVNEVERDGDGSPWPKTEEAERTGNSKSPRTLRSSCRLDESDNESPVTL
jgi:hypothetical protein